MAVEVSGEIDIRPKRLSVNYEEVHGRIWWSGDTHCVGVGDTWF